MTSPPPTGILGGEGRCLGQRFLRTHREAAGRQMVLVEPGGRALYPEKRRTLYEGLTGHWGSLRPKVVRPTTPAALPLLNCCRTRCQHRFLPRGPGTPVVFPSQACLVHTSETIRVCYFLERLMARRRPVMLVGTAGTGKSVLVGAKLASLDAEEHLVKNVPFNYYTTSAMLQGKGSGGVGRGGEGSHHVHARDAEPEGRSEGRSGTPAPAGFSLSLPSPAAALSHFPAPWAWSPSPSFLLRASLACSFPQSGSLTWDGSAP